MTKRVPIAIDTTVAGAINTAFGVLEELAEEMREAYENTPESLQSSAVGEARSEAADALESISEPDMPEWAADVAVKFTLLPLKRNASRSARRDEAVEYARQAFEALEAHREQQAAIETTDDENTDLIDALDALLDETQTMIDEAEAVEFPGMYA
jgi:sugar (pentulose or hexulose) kinase